MAAGGGVRRTRRHYNAGDAALTGNGGKQEPRDADWYAKRTDGDRRRRLTYAFIAVDVLCTVVIVVVLLLTQG